MKRFARLAVMLAIPLVLGYSLGAQEAAKPEENQTSPEERVVLTVGEDKLTAADVASILAALPPQSRAFYNGQGKHLLPQYLIRMKVMAAEARKQKLDTRPEVQQAFQIAQESILADALAKHLARTIPVSDQQVQELYKNRQGEFEQVRVRRLLIRTETSVLIEASPKRPPLSSEEARKKLEGLRQELLAGADFAEMAQTNSEDLTTAGAGGDMGYLSRQEMLPPIAQAAFSLAPGEVSEIIPTPYGLELFALEDRRVKPLEEVRPQLEARLRQGKVEELVQELLKQVPVQVDREFFSGPSPSPPPPVSSSRP